MALVYSRISYPFSCHWLRVGNLMTNTSINNEDKKKVRATSKVHNQQLFPMWDNNIQQPPSNSSKWVI